MDSSSMASGNRMPPSKQNPPFIMVKQEVPTGHAQSEGVQRGYNDPVAGNRARVLAVSKNSSSPLRYTLPPINSACPHDAPDIRTIQAYHLKTVLISISENTIQRNGKTTGGHHP